MTHDEIRIAKIEGLASLDELNTSLAEGFDIRGDPLVVNDRLTFVLIRKGKPDNLSYNNPYPTDKQMGYVSWAFGLDAGYASSCKVTRQEIGKIIEVHKKQPDGVLLDKKAFDATLDSLRKKEDPVKFDEDIPF